MGGKIDESASVALKLGRGNRLPPRLRNKRASRNVTINRMPFCTSCGNEVAPTDTFCALCGSRQTVTSAPNPRFLNEISPRTAAMACYIPLLGWIAAIVVLATSRFQHDREVRFHAFQGLYLFVAWLLVDWVIQPMFAFSMAGPNPLRALRGLAVLLQMSVFVAWIWMIIKTSQAQMYRLPIVGELAERSVAEQR